MTRPAPIDTVRLNHGDPMTTNPSSEITRAVARYVVRSRWADVPAAVQHKTVRSFLNWTGCAIRGSLHPAIDSALPVLRETAGAPQASVLGREDRLDMLNAALLNGLSASAYAFDDTHLQTIAHPTAPAAAALLALAEHRGMSGADFLHALMIAIEVQCRLSNALARAPAHCHVGLYMTGITGAAGVAAGVAKVLGLDEQHTIWAIGIGAAQGGGFRATHASMCSGYVPAHAGRNGLLAGLLAAKGFTSTDTILEARNGFADVFGSPADLSALTDRLGEHFECLAVAEKPYPAGVFVHPPIEACLALVAADPPSPEMIASVELRVHALALGLTGHREPRHAYEAQVSVYHWAAAALVHRAADLAQASDACVADPRVVAVRKRIEAVVDEALGADEAIAILRLTDGSERRVHIDPCVGSARQLMSDQQLERKFLAQVDDVLPAKRGRELAAQCWNIAAAKDVGTVAPGVWGVRNHSGSPVPR